MNREHAPRDEGALQSSPQPGSHESDADVGALSSSEQDRVLRQWNATAAVYDAEAFVHRVFEQHAAERPGAIAVHGPPAITYADLNRAAERVAARLLEHGVAGKLVGVCLERSPVMLAALLGAWKAGAAYVPIDPGYPEARVKMILEDARPQVVLTQRSLADRLRASSGEGPHVLAIDDAFEPGSQGNVPVPAATTRPEDPAYVLFTSGSTGRPKGVAVPHRALVNFLESMRKQPGMGPQDRLMAITTISFDISGLELYLPLVVGASLDLVDRDTVVDPAKLNAAFERAKPTILQATPSTWRMLIDAGFRGSPSLKALCGGEALPLDLARALLQRCGALWNMYGPTETTIWSTCHRFTEADAIVSIGKPSDNTQVYILADERRPVGVRVAGAPTIGGDGVALGYLGRADLTAERFVPNPFPGSRIGTMYRTGDLARWRPDGTIECLGRLDGQVKLRGYRIELEEIEIALRAHPAVARRRGGPRARPAGRSTARRLRGASAGGRRPPPTAPLREHLGKSLPEYMVPNTFVTLEKLPLTPNGKLDRKALPKPEEQRAAEQERGPGLAPAELQDPLERQILAAWKEILGTASVGENERFFDLGGHSITAVRLLTRLRRDCGVEVPIQIPLQNPTVREMAAAIRELIAKGDAAAAIARSASNANAFPASHAQVGVWLPHRFGVDNSVPVTVSFQGALSAPALARAFDELVRRHHVLRTTFVLEGGELVQRVAQPERAVLPTTDLSALDPDSQARELRRVESEVLAPSFDLERAPGWRAMLVRLGPREHRLYFTIHHIVVDAWALSHVLFRELESLYAAYALGRPLRLQPPPITYPDYAIWDRKTHSAEAMATKLEAWKARLAGIPRITSLPTDRPREGAEGYRSGLVKVRIPRALTDELHALARSEGVTLFMALLAGFDLLLHRESGQSDLVVGTPVSNRDRPEVERVLGCFLNELPIRVDLSGDPTVRELVQRARAATLDALARQEVPFHRIVSALRVPRSAHVHPVFQVMFLLQEDLAPPKFEGVEVKVDADERMGGYDLLFQVREGGEGLEGSFEYDAALFDQATIRNMAAKLEGVLAAMVASPDAKLGALQSGAPAKRAETTASAQDLREGKPRAARGEIEESFARDWAEVLGVPAIAATDDFFALGGQSLQAVQVLAALKESAGIDLHPREFVKAPTVEALAARVRAAKKAKHVAAIQPQGSKPPFFWIDALGVGGFSLVRYYKLAQRMGNDQPSYGLLEPSHVHPSVESWADYCIEWLRTVQPTGPYFLGGFCTGGNLAFQVAHQLRAQGDEVAMVALLDSFTPFEKARGSATRLEYAQTLVKNAVGFGARFLRMSGKEQLFLMNHELQKVRLRASTRLGLTPRDAVDTDEFETLVDTQHYDAEQLATTRKRFDMLMAHTWPNYAGQVHLFRPHRRGLMPRLPATGWELLARDVKVTVVPGTHDTMLKEPNVDALAARLTEALNDAQARAARG